MKEKWSMTGRYEVSLLNGDFAKSSAKVGDIVKTFATPEAAFGQQIGKLPDRFPTNVNHSIVPQFWRAMEQT